MDGGHKPYKKRRGLPTSITRELVAQERDFLQKSFCGQRPTAAPGAPPGDRSNDVSHPRGAHVACRGRKGLGSAAAARAAGRRGASRHATAQAHSRATACVTTTTQRAPPSIAAASEAQSLPPLKPHHTHAVRMRGERRQDTRSKCCGCKLAAALSRALARLSPHTTHADPAFSPSTASGTARGWLRWFAAHTGAAAVRGRPATQRTASASRAAAPRAAARGVAARHRGRCVARGGRWWRWRGGARGGGSAAAVNP